MKNTSPYAVVYILTKLELGGAQKVCLSLAQGLQHHKIPVTLISGNQGPLIPQAQQVSTTILLNSFKREVSVKGILHELTTFFKLVAVLRKLRKQHKKLIVHTHSTKAGILGRWAAWCAGIKQRVHTVHGYGFHEHQAAWLRRGIIALEWLTSLITTRFICVSTKDRETGTALFPRFAEKSCIIRAAVETERFFIPARKIIPTQSFTIGSIACFKPQKNIFDLLSAFQCVHAELLKNNVSSSLQLIGDGIQREAITQWVAEHGLGNAITLLGWQADVAPFLKNWDVFALSSLWEGLPCSIIEARLSKLPVIAYDVGGISDVIINNKNGFLIEPHDTKNLAHTLIRLGKSAALRNRLALHPDNLAAFSTESMVLQHRQLYQVLAKQ